MRGGVTLPRLRKIAIVRVLYDNAANKQRIEGILDASLFLPYHSLEETVFF